MADAVLLQHAADFDRLLGRIGAFAVDQQADIVAQGLPMSGTISSVRPGRSSWSWPHSLPTRNLKASW